MSAPASSTRQRSTASTALPGSTTDSKGVDHAKSGPQGKKLKQQDFTSFTSKLVLAVLAALMFYGWRLSIQSAEVGGWWNLIRGKGPANVPIAQQKAHSSLASNAAAAAATGVKATHGGRPETTVQEQILQLASSLGVKPRQLTEAIAPLLNPSIVSENDPAFADPAEEHGVVDTAADAAAGVGGVLGAAGTILETFVD